MGETRLRAIRARDAALAETAARVATAEGAAQERANAAIAEGERRAGAEIAANEARFRALIAHGDAAFVLLDNAGAVRFASPAASRLLGPEVERGGANLAASVHREDAQTFRALLDGEGTETVRLWAGDGWRWAEATANDLRDDPAIRALLVNLRDVTPQVRAAERDALLRGAADALLAGAGDAAAVVAVAGVAVPRFAAGCAVELAGEGGALGRAFTLLPPDLPPGAPDPFAAAGVSAHIVRALLTRRAAAFAPAPDAPPTLLVAPLVAHGETLGAVTFAAGERGPFDAADEATAALLAAYLALALVAART